MILRTLEGRIKEKLNKSKAIIVVGARQVGKTTLIQSILADKDILFLDADDPLVRNIMTSPNTEQIRSILGDKKFVFIDEAQRISGIGITLKIITDQFKDVQLIVSGSSSFDLGNLVNEPLTGRKWEFELFPISWEEYENNVGYLQSEKQLENRLLFGFYPDVINNVGSEREILNNLINSYLYRDILQLSDIRKPEVLEKLLQALALQIGSEVNYNELAQLVGINKITVQNYIEILERGYVIFRIESFSKNLRNEIKFGKKVYFYDNGIRNSIVSNFNPLDLRTDKGALWENFLVSERLKQNKYKNTYSKIYFWRTKQQQEVDLIEEKDGKITGFEFKWNSKKIKEPQNFKESYNSEIYLVNKDNFRSFINI